MCALVLPDGAGAYRTAMIAATLMCASVGVCATSSMAQSDVDYGTSVRRGSSGGNYSNESDYGTSVRRGRNSYVRVAPAAAVMPPPPVTIPTRRTTLMGEELIVPKDFTLDAPVVQIIEGDDFNDDVSYGTSVRAGAASSRHSSYRQITTTVRYSVKHTLHKATGGYHVFYMSAPLNGYHLYYVAPSGTQTYMGWHLNRR